MDDQPHSNTPVDTVVSEFASALRSRIGDHLRSLILYGSRARNQARTDSDYDCVVVVDRRSRAVQEAVLDAATAMLDRYDALVSPQVFDAEEWAAESRRPLGINVQREGLAL
ncbi:MAG: nucleotidyltransferase domain-containing protein [Candidatus Edwardsbacteria bacterium]|nr:nucleotidyltransferase domain-containing protein [Candidatus Edwardsbacteria bacterium]